MNIPRLIRPVTVCATVALVTLGARALPAQESTSANAWPQWLQEAMAKESRKLKSSKVAAGDGFFKSRLAGRLQGDAEAIDGGWYLASDIGTPSPLECWVFTDAVDPATMAANIAELTMQASAQRNGPLGERSVYFVDAGAYEGTPYLALEWMYSVGEAPNLLAGLAKVRVALRGEVSLACAHNYLGYRETFARGFKEFVSAADIESDSDSHYYEELIVQRIGEQPIGFSRITFTNDQEGDTEIRTVEASLYPVDASTLSTSDTWQSSYSRPDGTLINQTIAKSENGELTMLLELDPMDDGAWWVSGNYQGKELNQELVATVQPLSEVGQMLAVQHLLANDQRDDILLDVWVPSADPTQFLQAGIMVDPQRRQDGYGTMTIGPLSIAARFDTTGSLLSGRMQAGPMEMVLERVWVHGTPP